MELARTIADKPPMTMRRLKQNINFGTSGVEFLDALDHEGVQLQEHTATKVGQAEFAMMRQRFQEKQVTKRKAREAAAAAAAAAAGK